MRKLFVFFSMLAVAAVLSVNLSSCGGDDPIPAPTVRLLADVDPDDQYSVILTVEATDATSYSWNYGDGETSTNMGGHSYKYGESGDYSISVTVTNESGSASANASVTINPSLAEMLAGVDAGGKTWVVSRTASDNDGAGPLLPQDLVATMPFSAIPGGDVLGFLGFPDEYDNEFTFKPDGGYILDNVNGLNLCTAISAIYATGEPAPGGSWNMGQLGFASMAYTPEANPTWAVNEDATIELNVSSDRPETASEYTDGTVKYEGVTQLSITGAYFGLLDLSNVVMIESITKDKMQVVILMHTEKEVHSIFSRMTFIPK